MNKHPADASDNPGTPESGAAEPAPYRIYGNQAETNKDAGRDWVIPTILVLVTIVVISSTFFGEELAKLSAVGDLPYADEIDKRLVQSSESDHRVMHSASSGSAADAQVQANDAVASTVPADSRMASSPASRLPVSTQMPARVAGEAGYGQPGQPPVSVHDGRRETRASIVRRRAALRAEVRMRMQQDRRDMLRRVLEIQRDVRRAMSASRMQKNHTRPYSSTGYLM